MVEAFGSVGGELSDAAKKVAFAREADMHDWHAAHCREREYRV
jgi:hypothetical protein